MKQIIDIIYNPVIPPEEFRLSSPLGAADYDSDDDEDGDGDGNDDNRVDSDDDPVISSSRSHGVL